MHLPCLLPPRPLPLPQIPCRRTPTSNGPSVQGLLDAGAVLIGKLSMHELGLGATGR